MLSINYRDSDRRAEIRWTAGDERKAWLDVVRRLVLDHTDAATQENGFQISLPWWNFVSLRPQLFEVFKGYELAPERDISVGAEAVTLLRNSRRNTDLLYTVPANSRC